MQNSEALAKFIGGTFWMKSELILKKIRNNEVRFRSTPLRFGGIKTEKFSFHFLFFRAPFFLLKGKENFSVAPVRRIGGCFS